MTESDTLEIRRWEGRKEGGRKKVDRGGGRGEGEEEGGWRRGEVKRGRCEKPLESVNFQRLVGWSDVGRRAK